MTYPADVPNIALSGKAGAGKDTVAALLMTRFRLGYQRAALADPLKDIASILWGEDARTDRTKLQGLGVAVREIQEDTWVQLLLRNIRRRDAERPVQRLVALPMRFVVTDVRFPNELAALKAAGFVHIRVDAGRSLRIDRLRRNGKLQDEAQLDHASETALDDVKPNFIVTNEGTEDWLVGELQGILQRSRS